MEPGKNGLEWKLLLGFNIIAVAFLTVFAIVFYGVFPDVFGPESRSVFLPVLAGFDFVFLGSLFAAHRGLLTLARHLVSTATGIIVFASFALTGGFPVSNLTPLALVPPMVFLAFHGARAGIALSALFVAALFGQWLGVSAGIDLPDYATRGPTITTIIAYVSAFIITTAFFAIVEAENHRLRRHLAGERDGFAALARRDWLTGLDNARTFHESLDERLAATREHPAPLAVIYVDLDGFKAINDSLGHAAGDHVLIAMAECLRGVAGPHGMAARIGGDEFAILDASGDARATVERIRAAIAAMAVPGGSGLEVGASIGHAVHPYDGEDRRALMLAADGRMYADKLTRTARRLSAAERVSPARSGQAAARSA